MILILASMKIAIIDDHPIFRSGLKSLLEQVVPHSEIRLYENGEDFLMNIKHFTPYLAFLDVDLPGKHGIEICAEIKKDYPSVHVIILTMYKDFSLVKSALKCGANGFMVKENSVDEIVKCFETIRSGMIYITKAINEEELSRYLKSASVFNNMLNELLTKTERQVLKLISDKRSSREIADILFVTPKTIDIYRSRICKKLNLDGKSNSLLIWTIENADLLNELNEI